MKNLTRIARINIAAILAIILMAGSCGENQGDDDSGSKVPEKDNPSETAQDSMGFDIMALNSDKLGPEFDPSNFFPTPHINRRELNCVIDDLEEYFFIGEGTPGNMTYTELEPKKTIIPAFFLLGLMDGYQGNCTTEESGVVFHYGLNDQNQFVLGFSLCCLEAHGDSFGFAQALDHIYEYNDEDNIWIRGDADDLDDWRRIEWANYASNVHLIRNDIDSDKSVLDPNQEVNSMIYPKSRIDQFVYDNLDRIRDIEVVSFAAPRQWEPYLGDTPQNGLNFIHGISLMARSSWGKLLNNTDYGSNRKFARKAMDLGSPCPNYCPDDNSIFFAQEGNAVRCN